MTTPESRRRRERWQLRISIASLMFLVGLGIYQVVIVNPNTAGTQDAIKSTQVQIQATQAQQGKTTRHVHHLAINVKHALCALRKDLEGRVQQTQQFLAHPEAFPQFNDPSTLALIKQQAENQQHTIEALSGLHCDRFK